MFASGSMVINSDNTGWPEEILDLNEAIFFSLS